MPRRMLIAGNWKMNGLQGNRQEIDVLLSLLGGQAPGSLDVLICPPASLLADLTRDCAPGGIKTGGQDCHFADSGAHTGDISAPMLHDAGAEYVIVGHSERRADHHEDNALVKAKAEAGLRAGLDVIVCVGETLFEREEDRALDVVKTQILGSLPAGAGAHNCIIAYEPVWAIGTGKVASLHDIAQMHAHIRTVLDAEGGPELAQSRLLYGGSVKPDNAHEIFALDDVDGGLIGGASLKAADFAAIINAALANA